MLRSIKMLKPVTAVVLWLLLGNLAFAGTSQIFSPAGLPRSSTQDYSIPDTTVPLETFPSPPIPMTDMSLPGLGNVPLKEELTTNASKTPSPNASVVKSLNAPSNNASVESFFQYTPPPIEDFKATSKKQSGGFAPGKLLWHTLDNIGVPLPAPKDGDLAPDLKKDYVSHPQRLYEESNAKPIPQIIPPSQLGVTDTTANDDAKLH